jgi:hypothetical protein
MGNAGNERDRRDRKLDNDKRVIFVLSFPNLSPSHFALFSSPRSLDPARSRSIPLDPARSRSIPLDQ